MDCAIEERFSKPLLGTIGKIGYQGKQNGMLIWLLSQLLAIVGEQFDVGDEICGAVLSIRSSEDIISVWNKTAANGRINLKIR